MSWLNPNSDLKKQFNAFYENVEIVLGGIHQEVEKLKKEYDERLSYLDQLSDYFSDSEKLNLIKKAISDTEDTKNRLMIHLKEIEVKNIQLNEDHSKTIQQLQGQLSHLNEHYKNKCAALELSSTQLKSEIQDIKFSFAAKIKQTEATIDRLKNELDQQINQITEEVDNKNRILEDEIKQHCDKQFEILQKDFKFYRNFFYILLAVVLVLIILQFK